MTRIIILLLLFTATACGSRLAEGEVSERQIAELGLNPCHRIVINKGKIYYNGQQLKLGTPVQKWVDILGPYDREVIFDGRSYYWDKFGFAVSGDKDSIIAAFAVIFNSIMDELFDRDYDEVSLSIKKRLLENSCKYFFSGNILVDGAPLGRGSNIKDFVKQANCQWRVSFLPRLYRYEYRGEPDIPRTQATIYISPDYLDIEQFRIYIKDWD